MIGFFSTSEVEGQRPQALLAPRCGACGLYRGCQSPKMEPYGKGKRGVLVVGEAPGETEDEQGRPFVGKAGQYLREALAEIDVSLDRDAKTTNAIICRPPNNQTPDIKKIGYCRPNVLRAIHEFQPRVIVTLGKSALQSVVGMYWPKVDALEPWVGWRIPIEGHWVCPTYHPSYLMRIKNQVADRNFVRHLRRAFTLHEPPPQQDNFDKLIKVYMHEEPLLPVLEDIERKGGWVALDYETNCLKPDYPSAKIFSCALSNGETTVSFPWFGGKTWEAVRKIVASKRIKKIASNLKFEERWTRKEFGHGVSNWGWDTMLAAHCIDNRPGICSIKFQAFVLLGVPLYNQKIEPFLFPKKGTHYNRIEQANLATLLFYGGMDALCEHRAAMIQMERLPECPK